MVTETPKANGRIYDTLLQLKDAGLVAASAAAQVASTDKILDLGDGLVRGEVIIDVTAIEVASNDEVYTIYAEFSSSASFASGIVPGTSLRLGNSTANLLSADTSTGRWVLPFINDFGGTVYRYMRLWTEISGSIATGINYTAFVALARGN